MATSAASARPRVPKVPKWPPPPVCASPRVARLAADLDRLADRDDVPVLVADFWAEAERTGTPLVEADPDGSATHRVVTFLWREPAARSVVLRLNKVTDPSVWAESVLERLPGTDVWHRSYRLRDDYRGTYLIAADHGAVTTEDARLGPSLRWRGLAGAAQPDPRNPRTFPGKDGTPTSVVELPRARPQPYAARRASVPRGTLDAHEVPCPSLGGATRRVQVHRPAGGLPADAAVLVLLDGEDWAGRLDVGTTLDNLHADRAIPPTVTLLPDALDVETRWRELALDVAFLAFLTDDLLPWAAASLGVAPVPARTVLAGQSLGGLTAVFGGARAPHVFGRVLAQSASLWFPAGTPFDESAGTAVRAWVSAPGVEQTRVHLDVGLHEWMLLGWHRHLRDVVEARGVPVHYEEHHGGHDALCWRGGLADGLVELLRA